MTLRLDEKWVWDSWPFTDATGLHHLFYLQADRSLLHPALRHMHPSIGHATSRDYREWTILPDALAPSPGPAWDDATTWTGSVIQGDDGRYHLFYTGSSRAENCKIQRIGRADSEDLIHWERFGTEALVEADPRYYEKYDGSGAWNDEAFRDPWVIRDPEGNGWHMFITARSNTGDKFSRGVVGHAWSANLDRWEVRAPLSQPGPFGQLEVLQPVELPEGPHMVFSCATTEYSQALLEVGTPSGVWIMPGDGPLGPWHPEKARRIAHDSLYAARMIMDTDGQPKMLGFSDTVEGNFVGEILNPIPVIFDS